MTAIPRVSGVLETSLYVEDVNRSRGFYRRLFGFEQFMCDSRMRALGEQVLLLFRHGMTEKPAPAGGGFIPPHHGHGALHLCFAIPYGEPAAWESHLACSGIDIEGKLC
ncbi:MAG TPA: glyoxalase [Acetobacteraceae bacterium]|nr:glyoxalase [Acetobacteraceae bacterium]